MEKKFIEGQKGDDITPFDGTPPVPDAAETGPVIGHVPGIPPKSVCNHRESWTKQIQSYPFLKWKHLMKIENQCCGAGAEIK